jgi:hypothetical protein
MTKQKCDDGKGGWVEATHPKLFPLLRRSTASMAGTMRQFHGSIRGPDALGGSMIRTCIFTVTLALIAGPTALAQMPPQPPPVQNPTGQGNDHERAACHPDVMRWCKQLVKDSGQDDVFAILGCLQTNRTRISNACQQVLASHGQ